MLHVSSSDGFRISVLNKGRNALCKDERDKRFGLRELAPALSEWIVPNYEQTSAQAYLDTVMRSIENSGTLWMLEHAELSTARHDAPSWVPNWAASSNTRLQETIGYRYGPAEPHVRLMDRNVLRLVGLRLGSIRACWELTTSMFDLYHWGRMRTELVTLRESMLQDGVTVESLPMFVFLQIVFFGTKVTREGLDALSTCISRNENPAEYFGFNEWEKIIFLELHRYVLHNTKLYYTNSGDLGNGPLSLLPDDQVCVFLGASMASIIRKVDDYPQYRLVGPCLHRRHDRDPTRSGLYPHDWKSSNDSHLPGKPTEQDIEVIEVDENDTREESRRWDAVYDGKIRDPTLTPEYFRAKGLNIQYFDLV
ncbi:hypothetical protein P154DRAFT_569378 [Amniculicola lignicola CBS 123094]|uniref:Uncharacterized protein n=1 Tax=Amniculicola lignicola CBS 123094 TaxID=1392246 RepID=A0A6A5X3L1_9PLEO|nr:hypothetical protein P154DRAFT_569378 [Amniculicola lignicola CBS 123094]